MEVGEDFIIEENRHREIISAIKGIVKEMPKTEIDLSSLESVKTAIEDLLKSQESKKSESNDDKLILESIKSINDNFTKNFTELKEILKEGNRPKEYEFNIERLNGSDKISKVTATIKQ
jgi:hypothetical protein